MRDIPRIIEAKGAKIPIIGLGTWPLTGKDCVRLVEAAIETGYRHVDTAQMYGNEAEVGEAIRNSGLRDRIFLTTKVSHANQNAGALERSVRDSLAKMKLPFADLVLLHWPNEQI